MAKLLGDFFGKRRPGFTGVLMIDQVRGVTRVRAWPKKRGPVKSALQQQWVDWFRAANFAAKYASSSDIRRSIVLTKGTRWFPRDLLMRAMRGRLFWWEDEDGQAWYPVAAVVDVSDTLDVLADKIGNVLVRAGDRWRAPADGIEADVLTYHPAAPPDWQPVPVAPAGAFAGALRTRSGILTISRLVETVMTWQITHYDTDLFLGAGSSSSEYVIPDGFSWCRLTAGIRWAASSIGFRKMWFKQNGAVAPGSGMLMWLPAGGTPAAALVSAVLPCVKDDVFSLFVYHNHNSALAVQSDDEATHFSIQAFA